MFEHQIAQGSREKGRIIDLSDGIGARERHAPARIQEKVDRGVSLLMEALDVQSVTPGKDLPIHEFHLISGMILPVVTVLNAEPLKGAGMQGTVQQN